MRLTDKTLLALEKAAALHNGQVRKAKPGETPVPFITHPIVVASIVARHTDDEDIVAAALLHDTIEDTAYTAEEMRQEFGERVADIVLGVTIPEALEGEDTDWQKDRTRYLENLRQAPNESAVVAAADKMHNFGSSLEQFKNDKTAFQAKFGGNLDERITTYGAIIDVIFERIPPVLADELNEVWGAYKAFLKT